jgi:PAS domain S-box-containing protein
MSEHTKNKRFASGSATEDEPGSESPDAMPASRQTDDAGRGSEDRYRNILDTIEEAYYEVDLEGNFTFFNASVVKILGYNEDELMGLNFRLYMDTDTAKRVFEIYHNTYLTGNIVKGFDYDLITRKGNRIPVEASISLIRDRQSKPAGFKGILRDITNRKHTEKELEEYRDQLKGLVEERTCELTKTNQLLQQEIVERKHAEEALRESQQMLRLILDTIPQRVFWKDNNLSYLGCNRQFITDSGLATADDVIGKDDFSMSWASYAELYRRYDREVIESGLPMLNYELSETRSDGSQVWLRTSKMPILDAGRKVKGVLGVYEDITTPKMAEIALQTLNEELESRVIERTKQLETVNKDMKQVLEKLENAYTELKNTQSHLLQHEKMASIGQLAAGVAHEINNPIGFISSNLSTLEKYVDRILEYMSAEQSTLQQTGDKDLIEEFNENRKASKIDYITEDIRDLVKESLEGAERVRKIVQDLKSFSRVDQAEYKLAQINECIESTINIVWNELKYKATVKKEYGDIPLTKCYPQQLNQVFMNLLVNAAHSIEKQGIITITSWSENGSIIISVSDTGCGIKPANMNRIFEPFFTTKEVGKGTGLGLSITYDIIKKHGGEITVQSELDKGSTFIIRIPIVEA